MTSTSASLPRYGGWDQWRYPLLLNNSFQKQFVSEALSKPARFVDAEGMITCRVLWRELDPGFHPFA